MKRDSWADVPAMNFGDAATGAPPVSNLLQPEDLVRAHPPVQQQQRPQYTEEALRQMQMMQIQM